MFWVKRNQKSVKKKRTKAKSFLDFNHTIMKKLVLTFFAVFALAFSFAQTPEWKEMHEFHTIMSATFHPAEENNLKPCKENAKVLLTRALAWEKAQVPVGYNASLAKPILKQLVQDCKALTEAVKTKKSDKELKTLITKAHDTFHQFAEKCKE